MARPEGESASEPKAPSYVQVQPSDPGFSTDNMVAPSPYYNNTQQDQPYAAAEQPIHQAAMPEPAPAQFPPPNPQMMNPNPMGPPHQSGQAYPPPPAAFPPPHNPPPPEAYPPQKPAAYPPPPPPQQYPPPPPQFNSQPVQFPPPAGNVHQANIQPVQFPPPGPAPAVYPGGQMPPQSPMKPPAPGIPAVPMNNTEGWRTGLFDCMEDPTNAVITFLFPCLTFGQIAEIIDNGQTSCATGAILYALISSFIGIPCIYSCTYRTKLRSKFGLMEAPAPDWVVHFICEPCALCQAYRELNHRGFDPSIGWQGNLARNQQQQSQMAMIPPKPQRMM